MIKVIKQGTRKKVNCAECGSVLTYEAEDVQFEGKSPLPVPASQRRYIVCPVCKTEIVLQATR